MMSSVETPSALASKLGMMRWRSAGLAAWMRSSKATANRPSTSAETLAAQMMAWAPRGLTPAVMCRASLGSQCSEPGGGEHEAHGEVLHVGGDDDPPGELLGLDDVRPVEHGLDVVTVVRVVRWMMAFISLRVV
jgi:hypothetical protein